MLFAHGYGCDQHRWRHVTPAFDDFRVVCFDHVGAGRSDLSAYDPDRYASLDGYATDVLEICDALYLHDVIFVGHSVSAMIGVLAANREPDALRRRSCSSVRRRGTSTTTATSGGFGRRTSRSCSPPSDGNYHGWAQAMAPVIVGHADRPEQGIELAASFCRTDPEIAKRFARVTFLADNRADLPRVTVPTLVLQCPEDVIVSPDVGQYVARPHRGRASSCCSTPRGTARTSAHRGDCGGGQSPGSCADDRRGGDAHRRRFFDDAPCGFVAVTADGMIEHANRDVRRRWPPATSRISSASGSPTCSASAGRCTSRPTSRRCCC